MAITRRSCIAAASLAILAAAPAFAVVYSVDLTIPTNNYGTVDQRNVTSPNYPSFNNGGNACGPTSTVNSFTFLQNQYGITGLIPHVTGNSAQQDIYDAIIDLGTNYMGLPTSSATNPNGVFDQNFVAGKTQYIRDHGLTYGLTVEAQGNNINNNDTQPLHAVQTTPTWQFLYEQLQKGQDVEVGFSWLTPGGGGHWVTASSFYFDDANNNQVIDSGETAQMNFTDPWGGVLIQEFATNITMGTSGPQNGHMVLQYAGGAAGDSSDPENPSGGTSGYIDIIVAESPVPEPASLALLALGALPLLSRRRRA